MNANMYEYDDYKAYIIDLFLHSPDGKRGKRKSLAEFIGCHFSHITVVLNGNSQLSLEQAEAATRFFGMSDQEAEYFLLLVQYARSGTIDLKDFFYSLMEKARKTYNELNKRLEISNKLKEKQETQYYQSWIYAAIHALVSIPEFQTRQAIAEKLNEPLDKVNRILNFLTEADLISKEGQVYKVTNRSLHLDRSSPILANHHSNWRFRALKEFEENKKDSLHYSSVLTISKKDFKQVKEFFTKTLSESVSVIKDSKDEELASLNIDFYKL